MKALKNKLKIPLDLKITKPSMSWIKTDDDPLLKNKSSDVTELDENDLDIIAKMISYIDTCYNGKELGCKIRPGIAVAAPQMGLLKKIIYVHFNNEEGEEVKYLLANPEIISKSKIMSFIPRGEGCLSVPKDVKGNIPRNYKIIVHGIDLYTGEEIEFSAVELLSICLQHEIDHLDGILYTDRVNKDDPLHIDVSWLPVGR